MFCNCGYINFWTKKNVLGGTFLFRKEGKIININLEIKKGNLCSKRIETKIGTLDIIKDIYFTIKDSLIYEYEKENPKIKEIKIIPASIEIKEDDERTLSLIGVREDFKCEVILYTNLL